jgi:hypothetical protein
MSRNLNYELSIQNIEMAKRIREIERRQVTEGDARPCADLVVETFDVGISQGVRGCLTPSFSCGRTYKSGGVAAAINSSPDCCKQR